MKIHESSDQTFYKETELNDILSLVPTLNMN